MSRRPQNRITVSALAAGIGWVCLDKFEDRLRCFGDSAASSFALGLMYAAVTMFAVMVVSAVYKRRDSSQVKSSEPPSDQSPGSN